MARSCVQMKMIVKSYRKCVSKYNRVQDMLYSAASAIVVCRSMEDDYCLSVDRVGGTDIYDLYEVHMCGDLDYQDELITQTNYKTFLRWLDINDLVYFDEYCDCFNLPTSAEVENEC